VTTLVAVMAALCAIEALVSRARGRRALRLNDWLSGLLCGVLDHTVNAAAFVNFALLYASIVRAAPVRLPVNALTWVAMVLAHDLAYYAFHRASHRVALLWAAHEVHHQSDDYTLAVSLRQGTVATWVSWVFYAPLALVGFSVEQFVLVHLAHQAFQFVVHTRLLRTLGPLEWLLATPSHHRVHHGREPTQIDRNFGGFLIVWDRLFGTFEPERDEPRYGTPEGVQSWSPYWANLDPFRRVIERALRSRSPADALRALFGPPQSSSAVATDREPYDRAPEPFMRPYVVAQSAALVLVAWALTAQAKAPDSIVTVALTLWALLTLSAVGRMLDDRRGWRWFELVRLVASLLGAVVLVLVGAAPWIPAVGWIAGCLLSLYELTRPRPASDAA
jgi:sterol desaturase/sphingolipid hydroxylase (fatty acid hydroxylase superfamily)